MTHRLSVLLTAVLFIGCSGTPQESPLPASPDNIVLSVPGMH